MYLINMSSSQNNMTTQLEAILRRKEESMHKTMEKVLGQMQENIVQGYNVPERATQGGS